MLLSLRIDPLHRAFKLGYVAGFTQFLASLYWLLLIPLREFGIPFRPMLGWLALSAFLALLPACWLWICGTVKRDTWTARAVWAIACGAGWVASEMVRSRILSGFPWDPLGVSQYKFVPLIQIASITGVYGVSFLAVWFSASLFSCFSLLVQHPTRRRLWAAEIVLPVVAVIGIWWWGSNRVTPILNSGSERMLKLALIQPSIEQEVIWDETRTDERFAQLMDLSRKALAEKPDVIVWPEAAMPNFTRENVSAITNMIAEHRVWMIFGADDVEKKIDSDDWRFFNASFLFDPEGQYVAAYRKLRLVMFGEYIPLSEQLPFLQKFVPIGNFNSGKGPVQFSLGELRAKTSVLICFEDVFPHYTSAYADDDTDFLLNITNDGWFGDSAAQWQHGLTALFRAVENGIPLVRCTNNGLTCWIDGFGRIRQLFQSESGDIHGPGYLIASLPPDESPRVKTFYSKQGDVFGWSCVVMAVGLLVRKIRDKRANRVK